ncbi:MAG: response regulator [Acidiferrobacterales bacterium]
MPVHNVLVVDDSPTEIHLVGAMLKKHGYSVLSALSGEEALDLARTAHPDVVFMDILMPGMNGFEATRILSKDARTSDIPVVICSTKGQQTDLIWGLKQGAKAYLVKPVSEKDLLRAIHAIEGVQTP